MRALFVSAIMVGIVGMAFPPALIVAFLLAYLGNRLRKREARAVRTVLDVKAAKVADREYAQALKAFL